MQLIRLNCPWSHNFLCVNINTQCKLTVAEETEVTSYCCYSGQLGRSTQSVSSLFKVQYFF